MLLNFSYLLLKILNAENLQKSTMQKIFFIFIWLNQSWKFTLSLFDLLLKIAHFKEQLWAICSPCSLKKERPERIALVALYKRERKWVIRIFCMFFTAFPLFRPKSESLPSLSLCHFFSSLIALYKRGTVRDLLFFTSKSLFRSQNSKQFAWKAKERIPCPVKNLFKLASIPLLITFFGASFLLCNE